MNLNRNMLGPPGQDRNLSVQWTMLGDHVARECIPDECMKKQGQEKRQEGFRH